MDYSEICTQGADTVLHGVRNFSLEEILDCGQCFRWNRVADSRLVTYEGIAFGQRCVISQEKDRVVFHGCTEEEFHRVWRSYFDLDRDYSYLKELFTGDPVMAAAMDFCPGMRVLRQEPWEALCSFILSQNNNIKRIRGLVERFCVLLGEPLETGGFAFPAPGVLANCALQDLEPVRSGFRAAYLLDAARMAQAGQIDFEGLYTLPIVRAREMLRQIRGVGPKVAECALLYGWGREECFPEDVWIKRALQLHYPGGFPEEFRPWAGIAQQYLFHYMRCCPPDGVKGKDSAVTV